jgi:hypothetical protein
VAANEEGCALDSALGGRTGISGFDSVNSYSDPAGVNLARRCRRSEIVA